MSLPPSPAISCRCAVCPALTPHAVRVPFPLTLRFKPMLQRGIQLSTLSSSWVSSASFYFICLFGLRGVFTLLLGPDNDSDSMRAMQQQMQGMGGPQDPGKVRWLGPPVNRLPRLTSSTSCSSRCLLFAHTACSCRLFFQILYVDTYCEGRGCYCVTVCSTLGSRLQAFKKEQDDLHIVTHKFELDNVEQKLMVRGFSGSMSHHWRCTT